MSGWIYIHDLDPVIFFAGPLAVRWYGVMYVLAALAGLAGGKWSARRPGAMVPSAEVPTVLLFMLVGVVAGGRLGWVIFYGSVNDFAEPWRLLQIHGMSFHGGMLGTVAALWIYARRRGLALVPLADYCAPYVPIGLFLGRIGNFINGELYGKATGGDWGVIYPTDPQGIPRHPTQLYEGFLEGVVLFAALMVLRAIAPPRGVSSAAFLLIYGLSRSAVEFIRLPDAHIGYLAWGWVTMGQVLSFPMALAGAIWLGWIYANRSRKPARP